MLRSPADSTLYDQEWKDFLATQDFGQLIAFGVARRHPIVTPSHYIFDGKNNVELHLHRANPFFKAIAESPYVTFSVIAAHTYIPTYWNNDPNSDPSWAVPTSYYAAVQASGSATTIDTDSALADLLNRQMLRFQPEGKHHPVQPGDNPFGRMLAAIRGVRVAIQTVDAKFKFGGNRDPEHRLQIAERLASRSAPRDSEARSLLLHRHAIVERRTDSN